MSPMRLIEVLVAVHLDKPGLNAVKVSIDGDAKRATWIARSQLNAFDLTGKTTKGTDGMAKVTLPLANITIPEWLARDRGFI